MHEFEVSQPAETSPDKESATTAPVKPAKQADWQFQGKSVRVLFLGRNNSARSQIAEALTRSLSQGQIEVYSAGSSPAAQVHPAALHAIARLETDTSRYVPKPVDLFQGQSFDRVIVLCDPEHEECPALPGHTEAATWRLPDPASVEGTEKERSRAFKHLEMELNTRIRLLLTLLEREKRASV